MKIKLDNSSLFCDYYQIAASISDTRSSVGNEFGVKVVAEKNCVKLSTPPSHIVFNAFVETSEDCVVDETGTSFLQTKNIPDFLQKLKKKETSLAVCSDDKQVYFSNDKENIRARFNLQQEFEDADASISKKCNFFKIEIDAFLDSVQKTAPFIDKASANPVLNGIYIDVADCYESTNDDDYGTVRFVAVNSHCCSFIKRPVRGYEKDVNSKAKGFSVPMELVRYWVQAAKIAATCGIEECLIGFDGVSVYFQAGQAELKGATIEGYFPCYRSLFNEGELRQVKVGAGEAKNAIEVASTTTDMFSVGVYIKLSENKMEIFGQKQEIGAASMIVEVDWKDKELLCRVNPKELAASISGLEEDDSIVVKFKERKDEEKGGFMIYVDDAYCRRSFFAGMTV